MSLDPILGPILAQVALTIFVLWRLAFLRVSYIRKNGFAKLQVQGFPENTQNTSDNFKHQFETPVLFYVLGLLYVGPLVTTSAVLITAWIYVALRFVHAFIQLTHNKIFPWRFGVFVLSTVCLVVMLVMAILQVLTA